MKLLLKLGLLLFCFILLIFSCKSTQDTIEVSEEEKAIFEQEEIEDSNLEEESEYDIIVIDLGYNTWLQSIARPKGYYSQSFMESRNLIYVNEWNRRVLNPRRFNPNLYEQQINYESGIDYGYDVNYQLYNYFIYFQRKYNQRLGAFVPRI